MAGGSFGELVSAARDLAEQSPDSEVLAPREVNSSMIEHWCAVIGYEPVRREGVLVAPPAMLTAWTAGGERRVEGSSAAAVGEHLRSHGFGTISVPRFTQRDAREAREGEMLVVKGRISSVEERAGVVETVLDTDYESAGGEPVASQSFLMHWSQGPAALDVAPAPGQARPEAAGAERLEPFSLDVDAALIARAAVAARDDFVAHVDHHAAQALGYPDVILSLYNMAGIVGAHAARAAGPGARQLGQEIEVFRHTVPGEQLVFDATLRRDSDRVVVDALVGAENGLHVRSSTSLAEGSPQHLS